MVSVCKIGGTGANSFASTELNLVPGHILGKRGQRLTPFPQSWKMIYDFQSWKMTYVALNRCHRLDIRSHWHGIGSSGRMGGRQPPSNRKCGQGNGLYNRTIWRLGYGSSTRLSSTAAVDRSCNFFFPASGASCIARETFGFIV